MLYYTVDEFVCVLPSAKMEGGIKFHQGILAFVLAKAQVTVSTGKRGKYNSILCLFSMDWYQFSQYQHRRSSKQNCM